MTESHPFDLNSERAIAQRQRETRILEYFQLQQLKESHWCEKGVLCYVKQAALSYDVSTQGHELSYTLPSQKQTFCTMIGSASIKISQQVGPIEGAVLCHCHSPDCMDKLLNTLCALGHILK
ncbi:14.7K [Simian adenovirus 19]|uniref:14.7K n=1 Tax=Simian adenovirus 19 TaxID=38416 RepID=A0A0M3TH21_9ADEN|nr:14.7K [Simian adenovirus 19]ALE30446.1 14.7K [Simian adenovirus 19]